MDSRWLVKALVVAAVCSVNPAAAEDVSPAAIRQAIEGTWVLQEWDIDGSVVKAPEASGRLSLHDNIIIIMGTGDYFGQTRSFYGYGTYAVDGSTWSYAYDAYTFIRETSSKTSISKEIPWDGMRLFKARSEAGKVVLEYQGGHAQIVLSGDDFQYIESGRLIRRWTRITPN